MKLLQPTLIENWKYQNTLRSAKNDSKIIDLDIN